MVAHTALHMGVAHACRLRLARNSTSAQCCHRALVHVVAQSGLPSDQLAIVAVPPLATKGGTSVIMCGPRHLQEAGTSLWC